MESVDYSTNALVSQWYSGTPTKYLRQDEMKGLVDRLNNGDTLKIGIDYYGLYNISKFWMDALNKKIFYDVAQEINRGEVVVLSVWWDSKIGIVRYRRS